MDGNKRTGLASGIIFLQDNGLSSDYDVSDEELAQMAIDAASGKMSEKQLQDWTEEKFGKHIRQGRFSRKGGTSDILSRHAGAFRILKEYDEIIGPGQEVGFAPQNKKMEGETKRTYRSLVVRHSTTKERNDRLFADVYALGFLMTRTDDKNVKTFFKKDLNRFPP